MNSFDHTIIGYKISTEALTTLVLKDFVANYDTGNGDRQGDHILYEFYPDITIKHRRWRMPMRGVILSQAEFPDVFIGELLSRGQASGAVLISDVADNDGANNDTNGADNDNNGVDGDTSESLHTLVIRGIDDNGFLVDSTTEDYFVPAEAIIVIYSISAFMPVAVDTSRFIAAEKFINKLFSSGRLGSVRPQLGIYPYGF